MEGLHMKFTHLTLNSGHVCIQDTNSIMSDNPKVRNKVENYVSKMLSKSPLKDSGVPFIENTVVRGSLMSQGSYFVHLANADTNIPLVDSFGALDNESADVIWEHAKFCYKELMEEDIPFNKPKAPFVLDLIYPTMIFNLPVSRWSGDFTRCFATVLFDDYLSSSSPWYSYVTL